MHGVLPEEKENPQPFAVDIELRVDLRPAGRSDDLADTVDYAAVSDAVSRVVSAERYALIERLAERIAEVCLTDTRVTGVVVELRKLRPPVRVSLDHVGVRIER